MNKSKFLKKSLAMLLALMLVVAMIPLSASAALPDDLTSIKVNGQDVKLDNAKLEVKSLEEVTIGLNGPLTDGWYLRAVAGQNKFTDIDGAKVTEATVKREDGYITLDGTTGTVKLQLVNKNTTKETIEKSYTLTLQYVAAYTTTDIEIVDTGVGVYSAEIAEPGVIDIVLARSNDANDDTQNNIPAKITVKGLQGATINGNAVAEVPADANDSFVVVAENKTDKETWKYNVVSYQDAIDSFTLAGEEATFEDINKNNIVDTLKVIVPKDTDNENLPVEYVVNGDVDYTVNVFDNTTATGVPANKDVLNKDEITIAEFVNGVSNNVVEVSRWDEDGDGVKQYYNLVVEYEKSLDTAITYARMDRTNADIDELNISAVLPAYVGQGTDKKTELDKVTLTLYTEEFVSKVYAAGKAMKSTGSVDKFNDTTVDGKVWVSDTTVDLSKGPISVVVYAEDETKSTTYTVSATKAERADDAKMTSFYLMDEEGNTYGGTLGDKEYTLDVYVPYMTFNVDSWTVLAKASNNAKLQTSTGYDIISGVHKAANISGLSGEIKDANDVKTTTITAIDKNDPKITQKYTVNVKLDPDYAKGNELQNLRFTAQLENDFNNNPRTDTQFTNAIVRDENEFGTEIKHNTNNTYNVETLNIKVPKALQSNSEADYLNAVTEVLPVDDAVIFVCDRSEYGPVEQRIFYPIRTLPSTDTDVEETTTVLESDDLIFAVNEEVARAAMIDEKDNNGGKYGRINVTDLFNGKAVSTYGTMYKVQITVDAASSDNTLESFKVGETTLDVDNSAQGGTITGVLPWGLTFEKGEGEKGDKVPSMFAEFELSKYALLTSTDGKAVFFSNGDVDGDGETDSLPPWGESPAIYTKYKGVNRQFIFERDVDKDGNHIVNVYYAFVDDKGVLQSKQEITDITVLAEDRLTGEASRRTYKFALTWAEPETEADILTFKLGGYTGTIDDSDPQNRTITVKNVPYGTDITGMIAEFTTSPNAKVNLTNPAGIDVISGVTSINYTNPVLLYVQSEDGNQKNSYTVTIDMGLTFSDIDEDDWFYDDVVAAANEGYVEGMGDGKYEPKGSLTRAQFATMIARAMNYEDKPASPAAFTDVNGHWAANAINFCAENGIVDGYEDCTFKPDRAVTRQEVAAMLTRAFDLVEISDDKYPDDASISGWASEYVYKCLAAGLMKGDKDTGNFRPASILNRAEAATILMNANREGIID